MTHGYEFSKQKKDEKQGQKDKGTAYQYRPHQLL